MAASAVAMLLSACAEIPDTKSGAHQLAAVDVGLTGAAPETIAPDWWTAMADPQLDRIMGDALAHSPTLDAAMARLRAAEASIDAQRSGLLPHIDGDAQETRERLSDKYIIPPPFAGTSRWVGTTQAGLSWSLDLAGRQKALVAAAAANADTAGLDLAAARITLSVAIAQTYVNLRRACLQAEIADRFVASREEELRLARSRRTNRLGSDFDMRTAETLLAEARQARTRADGERAMAVHALAALAGRGADYYAAIDAPELPLDALLEVPQSLPADLLGRRPDILAAQARIDSADAGRRSARADFYPNVDLKALVGVSAIGLGNLFTGGAATYGAGPALHLPIFEGGRLRAGYRQAVAGQDEAIARYNETVVRALREAADALTAIDVTANLAADQVQVAHGLSETVRLDQVRVRTGLGAQLDVLDAQDRELAAAQRLADLQADGALARIQLVAALGGGFSPTIGERTALANPDASRR